MRDEGFSPREAALEGAVVRLRSVLMTSLLAMLGLLPMALSHGIGSVLHTMVEKKRPVEEIQL